MNNNTQSINLAGGAQLLCEGVSSPRPEQDHQEEDQGGAEELQPQLHGDAGVQDPTGGGQVQDAAGHGLGQQPVPGEHVPGLRHSPTEQP